MSFFNKIHSLSVNYLFAGFSDFLWSISAVSKLNSLIKIWYFLLREVLTLKDGGEVALDWKEDNTNQSSPIVLLLPGLTGSSQTEYAKALAISASKVGIRFVVFNNRGLGGMQLKVNKCLF